MEKILTHDFTVTEITAAMFVEPGKGTPTHRNRRFFGISMNVCSDTECKKTYTFSDGRSFTIGQNEIIFLPKGTSYTVSTKTTGNCYAINFELLSGDGLEPFVFKVKNASAYVNRFERARSLWQHKSPAYQMQCKAILYEILSSLQCEQAAEYLPRSTASLIEPAVEYIRHSFTAEEVCIADLAGMCKISEAYFRKIFKSVFGTSPVKYISGLKIAYAKELLTSEMYTVAEVAELSGFMDTSYFSREFKKATGYCPSDYVHKAYH